MPKVSVIIPVYNEEKYLRQCISSIANQTMQDIEILAINDGSLDNSLNILDELSRKYQGKLKVFDQQNRGAGIARNVGLDHANGEFIKFVDADDYLIGNILEKMYTIAKEHKVSLVRGNCRMVMKPFVMDDMCSWSDIRGSQEIDLRKNKDYIVTESPMIGNKLIDRKLFDNLRFPQTKWEDLGIIPVVIASSEKVYHIDEPVYNYRVNMNTTINDFIHKIPNILDIIRCLDNVERLMQERGLSKQYESQIESLYILHTLYRIENAMNWVNFPRQKKKNIVSSLLAILNAKYPNWMENSLLQRYREKNILFNLDMKRIKKFIKEEYQNVDTQTAKENIEKAFK